MISRDWEVKETEKNVSINVQLHFMIETLRSDFLTLSTTFCDLSVSNNLFSKAEKRQFGAVGTKGLRAGIRSCWKNWPERRLMLKSLWVLILWIFLFRLVVLGGKILDVNGEVQFWSSACELQFEGRIYSDTDICRNQNEQVNSSSYQILDKRSIKCRKGRDRAKTALSQIWDYLLEYVGGLKPGV